MSRFRHFDLKMLQSLLLELETKLSYLDFDFAGGSEPGSDVVPITQPKQRGRPPKRSG